MRVRIGMFLLLSLNNYMVGMEESPTHKKQPVRDLLLRAASRGDLDCLRRLLIEPHSPIADERALERAQEKSLSRVVTAIVDNCSKSYQTGLLLKRAVQHSQLETIYALRAYDVPVEEDLWRRAFTEKPEVVAALLTGPISPTNINSCYRSLIGTLYTETLDPLLVRFVLSLIRRPLYAQAFVGDDSFITKSKPFGDAPLWAVFGRQRAMVGKILDVLPLDQLDAESLVSIQQALLAAVTQDDSTITQNLITYVQQWAKLSAENTTHAQKLFNSALFKAAAYNKCKNVELLRKNGAIFEQFNEKSMEDLAAVVDAETAETLRKYGYDLFNHPTPIRLLQSAAKHGNLAMVRRCVSLTIDIDATCTPSALSLAAQNGHAAVVHELLALGAKDIKTSLGWAIEYGRTAVVREFLANGVLDSEDRQNAEKYLKWASELHEKGYTSDSEIPLRWTLSPKSPHSFTPIGLP